MSLGTWTGDRSLPASSRRAASRLGYRIGISLYAGMLFYCALSVLVGPAGISAYRRLEARKAAMGANLAELGTIRERLNAELDSLKSDPDRAAREARSLGYLRKGETAVILGERAESVRRIEVGKVLPYAEPAAIDDSAIKEIALGAALAVMALLCSPRTAIGTAASRRRP
jgi:cell division protein FtsB